MKTKPLISGIGAMLVMAGWGCSSSSHSGGVVHDHYPDHFYCHHCGFDHHYSHHHYHYYYQDTRPAPPPARVREPRRREPGPALPGPQLPLPPKPPGLP